MTLPRYEIIRDTREQAGWWFGEDDQCFGTVEKKLDTGDYTLKGLESVLAIERKGCIAEFAVNINEKRFENELDRLDEFDHAFLLLDFNPDDLEKFPVGSNIPSYKQKYIRVSPNYIRSKIVDYSLRHSTQILITGGFGKKYAKDIFRKTWAYYYKDALNGKTNEDKE
jgi:hypothetical protein